VSHTPDTNYGAPGTWSAFRHRPTLVAYAGVGGWCGMTEVSLALKDVVSRVRRTTGRASMEFLCPPYKEVGRGV